MFNIVLFEPEIPPNTGNIIRLCSNIGAQLHLIEPVAFELDDKRLRRAGLDYREWVQVKIHRSFNDFLETENPKRMFACSTKGVQPYAKVRYEENDYLLFGPESRGLPATILNSMQKENIVRIPMKPENRSLNLSNAVAIIVYEAYRQHDFRGLA